MNLQENIQRIKEIMGLVIETRQGMFNWLKEKLPNTPEYVIRDWVYNNYREVNYSQPLPDSILLGDIFFSDSKEYLKIQDIIATVFSGVIGVLKAKKVRVSEIELYPVNQDWSSDNKLRESIKNVLREITKY